MLGMDEKFYPTLYKRCNYLSRLWVKLIHDKKQSPGSMLRVLEFKCSSFEDFIRRDASYTHITHWNPYLLCGARFFQATLWIAWLKMPWFLVLPGHQQPWYWIYKMAGPVPSIRKTFLTNCNISLWNVDVNCEYMVIFRQNYPRAKGFNMVVPNSN